ncbi:MAG: ABC transporter substrate-binding protein [Deltaproteobacteria bacterium]|nr:ABC transporter substrate-binding protein [Deltaproteobacteria bacterium]
MKKWTLALSFVLLAFSVPLLSWAEGPTSTVQKLIESVRSYKPQATDSSPERAANSKALKVAEETLAIQDLAKRVLGDQWGKLSGTEQKNFSQLLVQLFQKIAYPKSAEFFGDLTIDYTGEKMNGSGAVVETKVSHPKEGQVGVDYQLHQVNGKWMIDDVLLDGVSLVTNVQSQMQQVINKESYQGLIKRMREKLAES